MSQKFSYSRLDCYGQCGWKYKLKYVDGNYIYQPTIATAYGTLIHAIEERMANLMKAGKEIDFDELRLDFEQMNVPKRSKYDRSGDLFGTKILAQKFPKEWHDFSSAKSGKSYAMKARDYEKNGIYTFPNYMQERPELEVVGAEVSFEYNYRGYVFNGFIDRLLKVKGENKFVIHDIKTKDTPYKDTELTSPRQFAIYAAAVRKMFDKKAEVECFYELPTLGMFQAAGTRGWEKRCWKKIDEFLDGIEDEDWAPKNSALCYWCEFCQINPSATEQGKGLCPYYSLYSPEHKDRLGQVEFEWKGIEHHEEVMEQFRKRMAQEELANKRQKYGDIDF